MMIETLFKMARLPLVERIGWALMHSVWQCVAIAVLLAVAMAILPKRSAQWRYVAGCIALLLALTAPIVTFFILAPHVAQHSAVAPAFISTIETDEVQITSVPTATAPISLDPLKQALPWAAVAWMVGVVVISARQIGGWIFVQQMRGSAVPIESRACAVCMSRLIDRLRIRRPVILAESARVLVPSLVGWTRPIILLPLGALSGLSIQHLEAILAHELAHVRRHDYLVNLIQSVVETLLFYHPAVWWISKQIRLERENCCDDLAVRVIGDVQVYSEALAAMEGIRSTGIAPALAVSGGSLLHRIRRLLKPEPRRAGVLWPTVIMVGLILTVAACSQVMTPKAQAQNDPKAPTTAPAVAVDQAPTAEPTPARPRVSARDINRNRLSDTGGSQNSGATQTVDAQMMPESPFATSRSNQTSAEQRVLSERLADLKVKLIEAQTQLGANSPKLAQLNQEIAALNAELERSEKVRADADFEKRMGERRVFAAAAWAPAPNAYYISGTSKPGMYSLDESGKTSLSKAIGEAGGLPDATDDKYILIVHQSTLQESAKRTQRIAANLLKDNADQPIVAGDVIMITDRATLPVSTEGRYRIEGPGLKPASYPLVRNMTLLQALVAAGLDPSDKLDAMVEVTYGQAADGKLFRSNPTRVPMSDVITGQAGMVIINPDAKITIRNGEGAATEAAAAPPVQASSPAPASR